MTSLKKTPKKDIEMFMNNRYWNFKYYNSNDLNDVLEEIKKS